MSASRDEDGTGVTLVADAVFSGSRDVPTPPSLLEAAARGHDRIANRYEVLALLGSGGMGSVYRVRDLELDEIVAMKVLRRELVGSEEALDRFRREVKLARRVTHKNVARTFDLGEHQGDRFITMELVDGEPLSAILGRTPVLPVSQVRVIVMGVLEGLAAAHAAGVVHRDLKPENVMISADGRVTITDFGVARATVIEAGARQTAAGVPVGTPAYMAPEQVMGSVDIDARADIYAFGVMFFELLTGHLPFERATVMATAVARLTEAPPDPRIHRKQLPDAIASITLDCLAREPAERVPSVEALLERFRLVTLHEMASPTRLPPPPKGVGSATLAAAGSATPTHKTVAVVPFRNLGGPGDAYLAESLAEDLTDVLSTTAGLRVRPPGMVRKLALSELDMRELGRKLDVQAIVEGSLRRTATGLRISVRVLGVGDGFQIWAGRLDRPESAIFTASDEIARSVAGALTVVAATPAREAPTDPAALDLYLRARHEAHGFWTGATRSAIALYEQALAISPDSPLVLAGYARARLRAWFHNDDESFGVEARQAAERAYAGAPHMAEANLALGTWHMYAGEGTEAVRLMRRACELGPLVAEAHDTLGRMLLEVGVGDEGARRISMAAAMEPRLGSLVLAERARFHVLRNQEGDEDEATALMATALAQAEQATIPFIRVAIARLALWRGDASAMREYAQAEPLPGTVASMLVSTFTQAAEQGAIGPEVSLFFENVARNERTPRRRRSLFHQMGVELACHMNDASMALRQLELADRAGLVDRVWVERCPLIRPLVDEPRYQDVARSVAARADGIVEAWRAG